MDESEEGVRRRQLKYVFKQYPFNYQSATIERWARGLQVFRFIGMWGGHANDDDEFAATISFNGLNELLHVAEVLGFTIPYVGLYVPQPELGKGYGFEEYLNFPSLVGDWAPGYAQPCWTRVLGEEAFVYIYESQVSIKSGSTKADPWFRGEKTFINAQRLDKKLAETKTNFLEPPGSSSLCISPSVYPEVWAGEIGTWAKQCEQESRFRKTGLEEEKKYSLPQGTISSEITVSTVCLTNVRTPQPELSQWTLVWHWGNKLVSRLKRLFRKVLHLIRKS